MRSSRGRARPAIVLAAAIALAACSAPGRRPAELDPLDHRSLRASAALPDDTEVAAGRLAAVVLADRPDTAGEILQAMREAEGARVTTGHQPSGLVDNGRDLIAALEGRRSYATHAEAMLEGEELDPVLRRRLEAYLESQPLRVAEKRIAENDRLRVASVFNRLSAPLSRLATGAVLNPIEAGRATLAATLVMRSLPEVTTQERQALRAYQDFLDREPDAPETEEIVTRVEEYQERWLGQLHAEAIELAQKSLDEGQPEVALLHLDRAERLRPGEAETDRLHDEALVLIESREAAIGRTVRARALVGVPLEPHAMDELAALAAAVLIAPPEHVVTRAQDWQARHRLEPLADEVRFLEAYRPYAHGYEDAYFEEMEAIADPESGPPTNMSRHARRILIDPEQNPYASYEHAKSVARGRTLRWLFLGRRAHGPLQRGLWRPLEWILDLPGFATTILTLPVRAFQYPSVRQRNMGPVLHRGEQYLARFPRGERAEEVRENLEALYAYRGQWALALTAHKGRKKVSPRTMARYRNEIAERRLEAAREQRRMDTRVALYRSIVTEFPNASQAADARRELRELLADHTAQSIRLTKSFLIEHPGLWAKDALGIRPELMDEDKGNGEIAEDGITLVGKNLIRIPLVGREPVLQSVPPEHFQRFVALLEETSYRALASDPREAAIADPQRDVFFERARLGLLDEFDMRLSAASTSVFESTREKHGFVRRRESLLPVELVLQGGLEDFAFAAFPRMHGPRPTSDAFLYE